MKSRTLAIVAVGVLITVSCGNDDDGDTADTEAASRPSTTAPVPTPEPSVAATTSPTPGSAVPTSAGPASDPPPAVTTTPPSTAPLGDPEIALVPVVQVEAAVDLAWREGDDGRYVVEQPGRVARLGADGNVSTVLDVTDLTEARSEQGLLGLDFSADGATAYINYTDDDGDTVVAAMPVAADGTFDRDSMTVVYTADQPYPNHNGGDLDVGPDGYLYIGLGDGGSGGDPERRATDLGSPLGKLLRIDPSDGADGFTVPADNPFVGEPGVLPEIWSSGLRNPWKFSFDPSTGDLWIADVGQNAFEEVNAVAATDGVGAGRGLSFGWSAFEGDARFNDDVTPDGHVAPVYVYEHGPGCSISGGARYRGDAIPALSGWYVYADYCSGDIVAVDVVDDGGEIAVGETVGLANVPSATAVIAGPDGELYVLSATGTVSLVTGE